MMRLRFFFFQAEDGIRDGRVMEFRRVLFRSNGAEQLLGRGDMLFLPPGSSRLMRVHGPLITEEEVSKVVAFLKTQGKPVYNERILEEPTESADTAETDGELD